MLHPLYLLWMVLPLAGATPSEDELQAKLQATIIHVDGCVGSHVQVHNLLRTSDKLVQFWACDTHCLSNGFRPLTHSYDVKTPLDWLGCRGGAAPTGGQRTACVRRLIAAGLRDPEPAQ
ncbi:hypothetical protein PCANC_16275 [Puccinia coronata f. sp. avenae]|uniref:CxC6 like cysteine cluster associated with KDZ domain-containing protein n=1 Tax=Puccinia coronata f. sp. avenae TaxID=200324 RepID=A0A2N5S634_9BASI|nr:hypothetical protein PCASD_22299 [Puccinia coronata f. sp. avenae]PLW33778.1 hypothetical protein PCANC_16275 [Puccinia coronata f. sp. avenae]